MQHETALASKAKDSGCAIPMGFLGIDSWPPAVWGLSHFPVPAASYSIKGHGLPPPPSLAGLVPLRDKLTWLG